ncbi:DotU family type IV/VI secretion system protein [Trinickia terrae]|uniref:DotU family type IV/VI secretion system protein n=2 Tax=Trinickia terrae TaxID=2571161 RepID=A0A4U1I495_9BURK|nr:DotU family type IV/VI secretion system protein [Trinickia terrae]
MRDMLRDAALLVATLAQGGVPAYSVADLRKHCRQLVHEFDSALEARRVAPAVKDEAVYALCGWLDETALTYLPSESKPEWDAHPLQVERFGNHHAGERIYEQLESRMRETPPNLELLECYAAILGLGFKGRYALDGEGKHAALAASLTELLVRAQPARDRAFIVERGAASGWSRLYRLSPWAVAGMALVVAGLVYVVCSHGLDAQLAYVIARKM